MCWKTGSPDGHQGCHDQGRWQRFLRDEKDEGRSCWKNTKGTVAPLATICGRTVVYRWDVTMDGSDVDLNMTSFGKKSWILKWCYANQICSCISWRLALRNCSEMTFSAPGDAGANGSLDQNLWELSLEQLERPICLSTTYFHCVIPSSLTSTDQNGRVHGS